MYIQNNLSIKSGDETGVQNVPKEDKFLGDVKKPLVNQVPADQGETGTVLTFVNAVGRVCPPMVIHKWLPKSLTFINKSSSLSSSEVYNVHNTWLSCNTICTLCWLRNFGCISISTSIVYAIISCCCNGWGL